MENLNQSKILAILFSLALTFTFLPGMAQDYKALQNAFRESYNHEYAGDYTRSVDVLKKVYDENSYELNLRLGWVSYKGGQFTESSAYYQKAMSLKPYSIEAKLGYTYPASSLGLHEQVKNQYLEILKISPEYTLANYKLGLIYYQREDYGTAYKYFEKVVNLFPFDYDSVVMFAWVHYRLGKLREAKVLFNKALLIKPNDSSALEGLGLIK